MHLAFGEGVVLMRVGVGLDIRVSMVNNWG